MSHIEHRVAAFAQFTGQSLAACSCFPPSLSVSLSPSLSVFDTNKYQNTLNTLNMHLSFLMLHYALISVAHSLTCLLCHSPSDSLIQTLIFPRYWLHQTIFLSAANSFLCFWAHIHSLPPMDLKWIGLRTTPTPTYTPSSLALDLSSQKTHRKPTVKQTFCPDYAKTLHKLFKMQQQCWSSLWD